MPEIWIPFRPVENPNLCADRRDEVWCVPDVIFELWRASADSMLCDKAVITLTSSKWRLGCILGP